MFETPQQITALTMGDLRRFVDRAEVGDDALVLLEFEGSAAAWRPMVEVTIDLDSDGNHTVYLWHSAPADGEGL